MVHVRWSIALLAIVCISLVIDTCIATSVYQNALVLAISSSDAEGATAILDGYGAPYDLIMVPQSGITLPTLETTTPCNEPVGLYGLIVVVSQLAYNYGGSIGYASALNSSQWNTLYAYQVKYGVRMVQLNIYPSAVAGVGVARWLLQWRRAADYVNRHEFGTYIGPQVCGVVYDWSVAQPCGCHGYKHDSNFSVPAVWHQLAVLFQFSGWCHENIL